MTNEPTNRDKTPNKARELNITDAQVYSLLASAVTHSEQVRWTRLNTLLVVNSILVVAWAAVFAGTQDFAHKSWLLTLLCLPGVVFGVLWAFLGSRSSRYLEAFHRKAEEIETRFPQDQIKLFHLSEKIREPVRKGFKRLTSSEWIVTWVPIAFSILFLGLILASWYCNPVK